MSKTCCRFLIVTLGLLACRVVRADAPDLVSYVPCSIEKWICWVGFGDDFNKVNWTKDIEFDPAKASPRANDKAPMGIEWIATPKTYTVTEEPLLYRNGHWLSKIEYQYNHPAADTTGRLIAVIFTWDNRPFCFLFGDSNFDEPPALFPHYRLEDSDKGTYLVISATMPGTGAFTTSNYFDFRSDKPQLVRKTESGRGFGHTVPVDHKSSDD
jgi:hypothetical protein